jgi:hypothetical protein
MPARMITLPVASLDQRLRLHGSLHGVVRSVNSKVIYLTSSEEMFLVIFPALVGNGPHYVLVEPYDDLGVLIVQNEPFSLSGASIEFPGRAILDCSQAAGWSPALMPGIDSSWKPHLQLASQYLILLGHHQAQDVLHEPEERFIQAAITQDWERLDQALHNLVGLGPGLTPAGDDFLTGFFGTFANLQLVCPGLLNFYEKASSMFLSSLPGRTHPVAEFFAKQFAAGYSSQIFQELLFSICSEEGEPALLENTRRLIRFGATSGTEMLRGMLAAIDTAGRQSWI